ncbi:hypothetical protein SH139x_005525 [Planctomycetaceae bacterium SH139]
MRRKRNARILFWPALAVSAVILVLIGAPRLRSFLGLQLAGVQGLNAGQDAARRADSQRDYAPPRTLDSSGRANAQLDPQSIDPQYYLRWAIRNPQATATDSQVDALCPSDILPRPAGEPLAQATLLAPVPDRQTELAGSGFAANGFADDDVFGVSSTRATAVNFRPGDRGNVADRERAEAGDPLGSAPQATLFSAGESLFLSDDPAAVSDRQREHAGQTDSQLDAEHSTDNSATDRRSLEVGPHGMAWPETPRLSATLSQLSEREELASLQPWISSVRQQLAELQSLPSLQAPQAGALIESLRQLAMAGLADGEARREQRELQQLVLRASHALLRRTAVWQAIWNVGDTTSHWRTVGLRNRETPALAATADELLARCRETGDFEGWNRYLMLDEIVLHDQRADVEPRRILAQRLLSRIEWEGLSEEQVSWLDDSSVHRLVRDIRPWADSPIDYAMLLRQLERLESDSLDLGKIEVAATVQSLRFSEHPPAVAVAEAINDYYRNGNLRLAVSASFMERLLPEIPARTTPIRQTIVGVPVRGTGVVHSQLAFQLLPNMGAWHLNLFTQGAIHGSTDSSRWPVQIANRSLSNFNAATELRVNRAGVEIGETAAAVNSHVKMRGMRTDFDGFPVIESLVRGIALSQYRDRAAAARRQSEQLVRDEIETTVSAEINQEIDRASSELSERLLGPLGRLRLSPLVVDLQTTESRLVARYRVAGNWQMAAFTPRPRALSNSLLSIQVHQSTLNNTFERLAPAGEPQALTEIYAQLMEMFGAEVPALDVDLPPNVKIQFANTRPITVEIEEDRLWLTLRVVRLTDERDLNLSHFVVRVAYRPVIDGLQTSLQREGVLRIDGPRLGMRERIPVRAIFNKVLNKDRQLPLVAKSLAAHPDAAGLTVGMLQLTDGWICFAICPADSTRSGAIAAKQRQQSVHR